MLVAIAEDDPDITFLLEAVLSDQGYDVAPSNSGVDALALCLERQPDILLLDRSMPGEVDGMEVLRRVRADPVIGTMPVVLLTAHAGQEQVEAGLAAGANAYLVKPFAMKDLLELVTELTRAGGEDAHG